MTSKAQLAEQAQKILVGGKVSPDEQVSIQQLVLCVQQAFATIVRLNFFEGKAEGENYVDGAFIYTFPKVAVEKDCETNMYYSVLPSSTITLPNETGIFHISLRKEQTKPFVRVPNGYVGLMSGLLVEAMEGFRTFFQEGTRIYYPTIKASDGVKEVLMKLVVGIDNIDDDEQLNIPKDLQLQIVNMAVELYSMEKAMPSDKQPDMV